MLVLYMSASFSSCKSLKFGILSYTAVFYEGLLYIFMSCENMWPHKEKRKKKHLISYSTQSRKQNWRVISLWLCFFNHFKNPFYVLVITSMSLIYSGIQYHFWESRLCSQTKPNLCNASVTKHFLKVFFFQRISLDSFKTKKNWAEEGKVLGCDWNWF